MWTSNFFRDPLKIICHQKYLSVKDIFNLRLVCKKWNDFLENKIKCYVGKIIRTNKELEGLCYGYRILSFLTEIDSVPENLISLSLYRNLPKRYPSGLKYLRISLKEYINYFNLGNLPKLRSLTLRVSRKCIFEGELPSQLKYLVLKSNRKDETDFPLKLPESLIHLSISNYLNVKFPKGLRYLRIETKRNLDLTSLHQLRHLFVSSSKRFPDIALLYIANSLRELSISSNMSLKLLNCKNNKIKKLTIFYNPNENFNFVKRIITSFDLLLEMLNKKQLNVNKLKTILIRTSNYIDCSLLPEFPELINFIVYKYTGEQIVINRECLNKNKKLKNIIISE